MGALKIIGIILLVIVLIIQGRYIFKDAIKNRLPNPWIWGILGLMNIPTSLIIYLIFKKVYLKRR